MIEKLSRVAEKVATSVSRRALLGRGLWGAAGVLGGLLAFPAIAQATVGNPCQYNSQCGSGEYCAAPVGQCGNGRCAPIRCGCRPIWSPVCGCDGRTYFNACDARCRGASIWHFGAC